MIIEFYDRQDKTNPYNGIKIGDSKKFFKILEEIFHGTPFFCELVGKNSYNLLLGISKDIGCVQYSPSDGSPPYMMAVEDIYCQEKGYIEFLTANIPTPVPIRYCISFGKLKRIVADFIEYGKRNDTVIWEEI